MKSNKVELIKLIQQFNRQICQLFRNDIFSFSFAVLFVSCLLLFLPRTYSINDNVGILFNAKQGLISEFTSFFYMKLLHLLYHITHDIPWYGLTLYFAHIFSLFIFVRSLARIKNFDTFFIPFLIVYLYFYSFFITQVDYTSTSIMVGANSLFAFLVLLNNRKISIFYVLGLGILFSLSFSIRIPGAFAVFVYGLPIIGLFLIYQYQKTKYFVIFFMPFLLLFIGDNLARTYLTSPEYQQYHDFNSLRRELHENPILRDNQNNHKILEANNWTPDDYNRFQRWNFFDERKYNTHTLGNIFKYSVSIEENKIQKYMSLYSQKLGELIKHPDIKWHIYFLLLISMLIIFKFYWFIVLAILCYLSYAISVCIYLDIFYRFPVRIAHPILLICASFVILLIFHLWSHKFTTKNTHGIFVTTFIIGVFWFLFNIGIHHNISTNIAFKLSLNRLQSAYQGKILYIPPNVLRWEKMDPLKRYHFNFHKIVYAGGTGTFSPGFYNELEKLGVKKGYEMIPALINNPNAYIVETKTNPYCVPPFMENYNLECDGVIIEQLPNDRVVIKLNPKTL
ncbi:MAG: hypothetical protein DRR16_00725 [Candidatus Parabeggiatoa sp. nov. 3]|nr:MAG: hypothetical protein DRR00_03100 [Gammaproteobacteria bacterium]RKZ59322.1 MAG: hypothetical protein DRQ99_23915 [Gammaproteobacteria bacterium]RKZ90072.1 MAG: hypothetical protein DRR16_00725 [Gammaproteobacteria bacterium]